MDAEILQKLLQASQQGKRYAFATIIESTLKGTPQKTGAKMVVFEDGTIFGTIGGGRYEKAAQLECQKAIKQQKPTTVTYSYFGQKGQSVCGGQIKVFIEPFTGQKHLIICGGGHIGLPLSVLGKMLNFRVTIIDNRKEFANKKRFGHVDKVMEGAYGTAISKIKINSDTLIMIVTQGNEFDFECLKAVINTQAGYIGVISSLAKRIKFFKRLKEEGIKSNLFNKVNIPAGIDIGAQTPGEIALAIMAEIISICKTDFIGTSKFREKNQEL